MKALRPLNPPLVMTLLVSTAVLAWGGWRMAYPCRGIQLGAPLSGQIRVVSPFEPSRSHYGTDYAVHGRESVLAAADGLVERVGFDYRRLAEPNLRSGLKTQGWGWYVILRHWNGSTTLYGHLNKSSVAHLRRGRLIRRGEALGRAGKSGATTGPHLHFEFSPSGLIFDASSKVDAHLCVNQAS